MISVDVTLKSFNHLPFSYFSSYFSFCQLFRSALLLTEKMVKDFYAQYFKGDSKNEVLLI